MKKIKNLFALSAIVFAFAGCNSCNQNKPKNNKGVVKIGAVLPLTGDVAKYGNWIKEGMNLAVDEINENDSFTKKIEIIYEDDKCDATFGTNAMTKLATIDKVPFVIGSWCSSSVLAQAPIAEKEKVIVLSEGLSPKISDAGDYIFRIIPTGKIYIDKLVEFIGKSGYKKVAVIYVNNDFGVGMTSYLEERIKSINGEVVEQQSYLSDTKDFKNQLLKVSSQKPDVVLLVSYEEAGYILKQAKELNLKLKFLGMDTFENPDILKVAGESANGVIYPHFFYENDTASNNALKVYQKKYFKKYNHFSEGFAAVSYDAVYLIAEILKNTDPNDKAKILETLQSIQYNGVTGLTSFDDNGDAKKNIILKEVINGRFVKH